MNVRSDNKVLPRVLPLLLVAGGWIFLYRSVFELLESRLNNEDFSYCYLIPFVAGYIAWQKRDDIVARLGGVTWPGYVGLLVAGILLLVGKVGSLETFLFASLWLSIVSIAFVWLGHRAMALLRFPALILLFIIPPPPFIERMLSFNLRLASSAFAAQILNILSVPVFQEGNIIDLGVMKLQVVDACSGLRYFLPTVLLSLVVGYFFNKRFLSRLVLLVASAPISLALNSLRITLTGILVRYVSPSLAEGFFHDFQGWAIYLATIALLAGTSLALRRFERSTPTGAEQAEQPGTAGAPPVTGATLPGMKVGLAMTCLLVVMSLGMESFIGSQTVPQWRNFDDFPLQIGEWEGQRAFLDKETLDNLWADDYVLGTYRNKRTGQILQLLVPYYKLQTAQHTAHAPASCLLGSGWDLAGKRELAPSPTTGRVFPVHQMLLKKGPDELLSNFWFQQRSRIITSEFMNKFYLFWDAMTKHRTDGALVRVEMVLAPGQSLDKAQAEVDLFTGQVENILRGYLPS